LRQNLDRVEEHYQQARQVVDRFGAGVANQLSALPGAEPLRRELLNETLGYYRQFIAYAADDPTLAAEMAATNVKAAVIAESLGDRNNALDHARKAVELFDRLAHEAPADEQLAIDHAKARNSLGVLLAAAGNSDDALVAYRQAIVELQPLADTDNKARHVTAARALAESYSNVGLLEGRLGRAEDARGALNASIQLLEKLVAEAPHESGARYDLAIGHNNLSFVERQFDLPASEQSCRRAITLLEKLVAEDAAPLAYRSDLALCYNNLGAILGRREQWQEACNSYERAINLQRQLTRQASAVVSYRRDLAVSLNNLGQAQQQLGDLSAATASFGAAQEIVALLVSDYSDELTFRSLYGAVLNNRAMALEKAGEMEDALAAFELAIVNQRIACERAPQVAEYREFLSKHYFNYGRALRSAGQPAKAAAVALDRRKLWPEHGEHLGQIAVELAQAATQLGEQAGADGASQHVKKIESQIVDTLQAAAAAGCDMTILRSDPAFQFLQNDTLWANLGKTQPSPKP
jgi:tetratricopeptide (TPR) repeat protein